MNLEIVKQTEQTKKLANTFSQEEIPHHIEDSKYQIDIELEHYVEEFYSKDIFDENSIYTTSDKLITKIQIIKSRENYLLNHNDAIGFRFFDIIKLNINDEILLGNKRHNETPIIYKGKRFTLEMVNDYLKDKYLKKYMIDYGITNVILCEYENIMIPKENEITYDEYQKSLEKEKSNPKCKITNSFRQDNNMTKHHSNMEKLKFFLIESGVYYNELIQGKNIDEIFRSIFSNFWPDSSYDRALDALAYAYAKIIENKIPIAPVTAHPILVRIKKMKEK